MTREDAATIFERIATLLELKGENPFKTRAYRAGAEIQELVYLPVLGQAGSI